MAKKPKEAAPAAAPERQDSSLPPAQPNRAAEAASERQEDEVSPRRVATGTATWPLPAGVPPEVLDGADLVVTAKAATGRRRAGRAFSRDEETVIALSDLSEDEIAAITGDGELTCAVRFYRPG